MENMFKIAAIAVAGALCAVTLKKQTPELALMVALTAGALVLVSSITALEQVRLLIGELSEAAGLSSAVVAPVIKTVAIAVITKLSAEICRDAKEGGIAAFVEMAGAAAALAVTLPLIELVMKVVTGLL